MKHVEQRIRWAITMMAATVIVNVAGVIATFRWNSDAPLGLAAGTTAMFAFVGMLALSQEPGDTWRITEAGMRTAIASALVAEYVALISMVTFNPRLPSTFAPVSQTLVASFTTVVGVVLAFYFGTSAYVEGKRLTMSRSNDAASDRAITPDSRTIT